MEFIFATPGEFTGDFMEGFALRVTAKLREGYQPYGGFKVHTPQWTAHTILVHQNLMIQAVVKKAGPIVEYKVGTATPDAPDRLAHQDRAWIPQGEPCFLQNGVVCQAFIKYEADLLGLHETH